MSLLIGRAIGLAILAETRHWAKFAGAAALSVSMLVGLGLLDRWDRFAVTPDWFSISSIILTGGFLAGGYALPAWRTHARPIWPLLILPVLVAMMAAVRSGNIGDICAFTLLVLLSLALGRAALRRLGVTDAQFPVAGALGLSLLILVFRLLGACGGVSSSSILIALAVLVVAVRSELADAVRSLSHNISTSRTFLVSEWVVLGIGTALGLIFWCSSLAPETGSDAIGGRSALPLIWERAGSITAVREIFTSYMGIGGEILNLITLPLAGENMAKITTLVSAFFLAGAISGACSARSRILPWLSSFVFFSSTVVAWQFIHGFVDMHVAFLAVASLLALDAWIADRKNAWLLVAGLIAGSAVSIKLHAGTAFLLLAGGVLRGCEVHRGRIRHAWKPLLFLLAGITLGLAPSIARTFLLTGNPLFPFANGIFKSSLADVNLSKRLPSYGSGLSLQVLTLPFRTLWKPYSFNELGTYHPANWLLAVFSIGMLPWSDAKAKRWWVAAGAFWMGWVLTEQNLRYSIPALACTAIAIASTGRTIGPKWNFAAWTAVLVLTLGTILGFSRPSAWIWSESSGPALPKKYLRGRHSAEQFQALYLPSSVLARSVNDNFGSTAVIWQIPNFRDHLSFRGRTISYPHGDLALLRALYATLPPPPAGASDDPAYRVNPVQLSDDVVYHALLSNGITHVMWDSLSPWVRGLPESEWSGIFSEKFASKYLRLESANGHNSFVRLYRVLPEAKLSVKRGIVVTEPWTEGETEVKAESLIGVQVKWTSPLPAGAFFDIVCWSADRQLRYWERVPLDFSAASGWHRRWQTVPLGAGAMQINKSPGIEAVELSIVRPNDWP
jgi:hypothetical protein